MSNLIFEIKETWKLYIIRCGDGTLYTGITLNIEKRLKRHRVGKGSKYTRFRQPLTLVYLKEVGDHSSALKEEYRIKHLSKIEKETLIVNEGIYFNSSDHKKEKQISRDEDAKMLKSGEITKEELIKSNTFLSKDFIKK